MGNLIGWLWLAIGGSHVSDRLIVNFVDFNVFVVAFSVCMVYLSAVDINFLSFSYCPVSVFLSLVHSL